MAYSSYGVVSNDRKLRQKACVSLCLLENQVREPLWTKGMVLQLSQACSGCCPESGTKEEEDGGKIPARGDEAQNSGWVTGTQGHAPRGPGMTPRPATA